MDIFPLRGWGVFDKKEKRGIRKIPSSRTEKNHGQGMRVRIGR